MSGRGAENAPSPAGWQPALLGCCSQMFPKIRPPFFQEEARIWTDVSQTQRLLIALVVFLPTRSQHIQSGHSHRGWGAKPGCWVPPPQPLGPFFRQQSCWSWLGGRPGWQEPARGRWQSGMDGPWEGRAKGKLPSAGCSSPSSSAVVQ